MKKPLNKPPTAKPQCSEDGELFRLAIGEVIPLTHNQAALKRKPPKPIPRKALEDQQIVMRELAVPVGNEPSIEEGDLISHAQNGISAQVVKKLGKGNYSVQDTLDLHQMTAAVATEAITLFLAHAAREQRSCVKIIHGKGLRSRASGPVLKGLTEKLLRRRSDVLAFRSARPADGGSGAVLVLLRSKPPN